MLKKKLEKNLPEGHHKTKAMPVFAVYLFLLIWSVTAIEDSLLDELAEHNLLDDAQLGFLIALATALLIFIRYLSKILQELKVFWNLLFPDKPLRAHIKAQEVIITKQLLNKRYHLAIHNILKDSLATRYIKEHILSLAQINHIKVRKIQAKEEEHIQLTPVYLKRALETLQDKLEQWHHQLDEKKMQKLQQYIELVLTSAHTTARNSFYTNDIQKGD